MKKLNPPAIDDALKIDEIILARQSGANAAAFTTYQAVWKREVELYLRLAGKFGWVKKYKTPAAPLKTALINLYNSANVDNERKYICQIREDHRSQCCPMCGRPGADTIDHILPKDEYPQFALLSKNLVPCCERCNRVKNKAIPSSSKSRYLHPYYDTFLVGHVIKLDIKFYLDVPIFKILPAGGLTDIEKSVVTFHLKQLQINSKIIMHFRNTWRSFLKMIDKIWVVSTTVNNVMDKLNERILGFLDIKDEEFETVNNWDSVFYRAFQQDQILLRRVVVKRAPVAAQA